MKKVMLAIAIAFSLNVSAQVFATPVVMESPFAAGGNAGDFTSQVVVNGNPSIAYYDNTHQDLMFVRSADSNGTAWNAPVIVDPAYNAGWFCSMKIVDGYPAIAYVDLTFHQLQYVRALDSNGTSWGTPIALQSAPGYYSSFLSMEIVNGNPAIAFCDGLWNDVKYIRATDNIGTTWAPAQTIATTGSLSNVQILIVNGNPALAFVDTQTWTLYYVRANDVFGAAWGSPIPISASGDEAAEFGFAMTGGKPAVAYSNLNTNALKVVVANDNTGTSWQTPLTLDISTGDMRWTSMINSNGNLMIAYYAPGTNNTKFIRSLDTNGITWDIPTQANPSNEEGWCISLCLVNGCPAVAHGDNSAAPNNLKYVRSNDALGTTWGTEMIIDSPHPSGNRLSMALVQGKPAVASTNSFNQKLVYCRAVDSIGNYWSTSIELNTTQPGGGFTSIDVINGFPAIAFTGSNPNRLRYMTAADAVGNTWNNPVRVDSIVAAQNCTLLNLNGIPAIAYWDATNSTIRFTHANNAQGTSWSTSITPLPTSSSLFDFDIVQGKPAIAFVNSNFELYYCRALDSLGNSWDTPTQVTNVVGYDTRPSLEVVDGQPAIAFRDPIIYCAGYCRSTDSLGTSWSLPTVTSVNDFGGEDPTLLFHDGRPVISYVGIYHERNFVSAIDRVGSSWSASVFIDSIRYPGVIMQSEAIDVHGRVGVGYNQYTDKYGYYSSACVAPLPPSVTQPNAICGGGSASILTSGYGTLSWYTSSTGGTYLGTGSSFTTPILSSTTTYYVQDSTCAASTRTAVTIIVNPLPSISLNGNTQLCSGDSTTLSVSGNGDGFEWSTGSINMSESFVPASTTNYWVMTYDGSGCADTIFFAVNVTLPQTTTQTIPLCDGDSYTVGSNTYSAAGTYTDSLTTIQAGCDSVVVTTITVQPAIDTTVNYSSGVLTSNETGATYQWINCTTQQSVSGATNLNFTPTQNGTYAVAIVNGPCVDTSICYTVTDVGVDEIVSNAAALIVTSHSGQINAVVQIGTGIVTYEFYNALGELVLRKSGQVGEVVIFDTRSSGMYVVKATAAGSTMVKRVLVQ